MSPGAAKGTNTTFSPALATAFPSEPASIISTFSNKGNGLFLLPIFLQFMAKIIEGFY